MRYEVRFQDPSEATTRYLYEEVVAQLLDDRVVEVECIFAFASGNGVLELLQDSSFRQYMDRGGYFHVLVGWDAVTDRRALDALQEAESNLGPEFSARVFKSQQPGLFHPKMLRFKRADGSGRIVIGSGNLTPGGLRTNIEAYSVLDYDSGLVPDQSEWDAFLTNHASEISIIDDEALERGDRNASARRLARRIARRTSRSPRPEAVDEELAAREESPQLTELPPPAPADKMLVAAVPMGGGRWHQVHMNIPAIEVYFRARPGTPDRVYLYRYDATGTVVPEPPRRVVYSASSNRNHKIEFGAHAGEAYPTGGPPILVLRELGLRQHLYAMLLPGDAGYAEMEAFLAARPSIGPGVPRVIAPHADVVAAWPATPI